MWNDRIPHLVWKQHSTDFGTLSGFLWSQELCNPTTSTRLGSSSLAKWLQNLPQPIVVPSVEYFWLFHSLEYLLKHVQTIVLELFWAEHMEQAKLIYCQYEFSAAEISFINSWPSYYITCCVCKKVMESSYTGGYSVNHSAIYSWEVQCSSYIHWDANQPQTDEYNSSSSSVDFSRHFERFLLTFTNLVVHSLLSGCFSLTSFPVSPLHEWNLGWNLGRGLLMRIASAQDP